MEPIPSSGFQNNFNNSPLERDCILLHETRYFLNVSKSKYVSVGIFYDNYNQCFKPSVWFGGPKFKNCVILDDRDWTNFLKLKKLINSTDNNTPIMLNSCKITFETFNDIRVLKLEDNFSNSIYLGDESVLGLWKISDVVQYRLNMLECLNFDIYLKNILASISNFSGDNLVDSVDKKISSGSLNENVCIAKEFVARYPSCLEQIKHKPFGYY